MIKIGDIFGRLTVLEKGPIKGRQRHWICKCECGKEHTVAGSSLKSGDSKSCGCLNSELASARETTHGMYGTPEYNTWAAMIQRCTNPKNPAYKDYGGRGIAVCRRWLKFENFYADMGKRPEGKSLDRYPDNNGNYKPGNCRWATQAEQTSNQRTNRFIEYAGERMTLSDWARRTGIKREALAWRLNNGWPIEKALAK